MTSLTLQDCELDDYQFKIIIDGFRQLKYLDISSNRMEEANALAEICSGIEILKVGPRLISNNVSADIPMKPIVTGHGRFVNELYIQGFLSTKLESISQMNNLSKLVIRFIKPLFDDINISNCFNSIGQLNSLRCLEIYQVCSIQLYLMFIMKMYQIL